MVAKSVIPLVYKEVFSLVFLGGGSLWFLLGTTSELSKGYSYSKISSFFGDFIITVFFFFPC